MLQQTKSPEKQNTSCHPEPLSTTFRSVGQALGPDPARWNVASDDAATAAQTAFRKGQCIASTSELSLDVEPMTNERLGAVQAVVFSMRHQDGSTAVTKFDVPFAMDKLRDPDQRQMIESQLSLVRAAKPAVAEAFDEYRQAVSSLGRTEGELEKFARLRLGAQLGKALNINEPGEILADLAPDRHSGYVLIRNPSTKQLLLYGELRAGKPFELGLTLRNPPTPGNCPIPPQDDPDHRV